jgi:hypothetical protein
VKRVLMTAALLALVVGTGDAQRPRQPRPGDAPPPAGADSMRGRMGPPGQDGMMGDDPRRAQMREQVQERMGRMIQTELQLSETDMGRVRQAMRANQDRRIAMMRREEDLRRGIGNQLQPGQAANNDSLSRMMDAVTHLRVERAESDEQMMRELNFLPAVKRARLGMMLQRFEERVREIRQQRAPMMRRMR